MRRTLGKWYVTAHRRRGYYCRAMAVCSRTRMLLHSAIIQQKHARSKWYVAVCRLEATKNSTQPYPLHTLRGHVRELTAVALSYELSIAASVGCCFNRCKQVAQRVSHTRRTFFSQGAADGCVLLHTTHNGSLVRNVVHPDKQPVGHLLVSAIHCRVVIGAHTCSLPRDAVLDCIVVIRTSPVPHAILRWSRGLHHG